MADDPDGKRAYVGYEPSGVLHIGHMLTANKLIDLQEAGFEVTVLLADDVHAYLNDKGSFEEIRHTAERMRDQFIAYGLDDVEHAVRARLRLPARRRLHAGSPLTGVRDDARAGRARDGRDHLRRLREGVAGGVPPDAGARHSVPRRRPRGRRDGAAEGPHARARRASEHRPRTRRRASTPRSSPIWALAAGRCPPARASPSRWRTPARISSRR